MTLKNLSHVIDTPVKKTDETGWINRIQRKILFSFLKQLKKGKISIIEKDSRQVFGTLSDDFPLSAAVTVHDPRAYGKILFGGSVGAGEAYMEGLWSTDQLTELVRIFLRNRTVLERMEKGLAAPKRLFNLFGHTFRRNTKPGSRKNISDHYDLSNEFFSLFLDDTMMYSCGVFKDENASLREASVQKNDLICQKIELSPKDHLLEIGTGWGGFAIHAARHYGCRVTTTTISKAQYEFARKRIQEEGLTDRITVLYQDYRDLQGSFDKIVSIEMIEAIGHQYYDIFFKHCSDLLRPDGRMLLQAITIMDQHYEAAKDSVDFIKKIIFPGSCIPSVKALSHAVAQSTDMDLFHLEDIGRHYAPTLRFWKKRLLQNKESIRRLGLSKSFVRGWEFYFSYCEGGFIERSISDIQLLLVKPMFRPGL